MKQHILSFLLILCLVLSLAACSTPGETPTQAEGSTSAPTEAETTALETTEAPTEPPLPTPQVIEESGVGDYDVQIDSMEVYPGSPGYTLLIRYSLINNSQEATDRYHIFANFYQNGLSLPIAAFSGSDPYCDELSSQEAANTWDQKIQPGERLKVVEIRTLNSLTAPLELEFRYMDKNYTCEAEKDFTISLSEDGVTELSVAPVGDTVETLGDYTVSVVSQEVMKDRDGEDCIFIRLGYTNNSDIAQAFDRSIAFSVTQDGVNLDETHCDEENYPYPDCITQEHLFVKPGVGIPVYPAYKLNSTSPVTVKISALPLSASDSDEGVEYTFDVSQ